MTAPRLLAVEELLGLLRALPPGGRLWLPGVGSSLWPVLRSGDAVQVVRAVGAAPPRGTLALCSTGARVFVHVVLAEAPVRTGSLRGVEDPPGEVLGVVRAVRRNARVWRIGRMTERTLWLLASTAVLARRSEATRRAWRALVEGATSRWSSGMRRRWMGHLVVRPLGGGDLGALIRFAGDHSRLQPGTLIARFDAQWTREGTAVGAFDRRGELAGFAFLGSFRSEGIAVEGLFIRQLMVRPLARSLGVGRRLIRALVAAAEQRGVTAVRADVDADNRTSLRAFAAEGFLRRDDPAARQICETLEAISPGRQVVLLERPSHSA